MSENSGAGYAAVIKRGGDDLEAASVRLTLMDISARYVKDYTVEVPGSVFFERDVENASGAGSLIDEFEANDGRLDEINGVDNIAKLGKTDPVNDTRSYSQQTFFFETKDQNEDNIITLSCEKADSRKYALTGTAHYSEIALATGIEGEVWRPAPGLFVTLGKTVFGISDDSGSFATIPMYGIKGCSVIYKTEGAGRERYGTAVLTDNAVREIDNGSGGKDTVNAVSIGDKKIEDSVLLDFALNAHGALCFYVGAGIAGAFGARGGAEVDMNFVYYPTVSMTYDMNPVGLQITVGLKMWVDVVLFSVPSPQLRLVNKRYGCFEDIDKQAADNDDPAQADNDGHGAALRKGSGKTEKWLPDGDTAELMSTYEIKKTTALSADGYECASPQLMDLGFGRTLLVYLSSDPSKGDYDRTSLVYNIFENGQWKYEEPLKVNPDSTGGEFEPNLCDMGDNVLISWTSRDSAGAASASTMWIMTLTTGTR